MLKINVYARHTSCMIVVHVHMNIHVVGQMHNKSTTKLLYLVLDRSEVIYLRYPGHEAAGGHHLSSEVFDNSLQLLGELIRIKDEVGGWHWKTRVVDQSERDVKGFSYLQLLNETVLSLC